MELLLVLECQRVAAQAGRDCPEPVRRELNRLRTACSDNSLKSMGLMRVVRPFTELICSAEVNCNTTVLALTALIKLAEAGFFVSTADCHNEALVEIVRAAAQCRFEATEDPLKDESVLLEVLHLQRCCLQLDVDHTRRGGSPLLDEKSVWLILTTSFRFHLRVQPYSIMLRQQAENSLFEVTRNIFAKLDFQHNKRAGVESGASTPNSSQAVPLSSSLSSSSQASAASLLQLLVTLADSVLRFQSGGQAATERQSEEGEAEGPVSSSESLTEEGYQPAQAEFSIYVPVASDEHGCLQRCVLVLELLQVALLAGGGSLSRLPALVHTLQGPLTLFLAVSARFDGAASVLAAVLRCCHLIIVHLRHKLPVQVEWILTHIHLPILSARGGGSSGSSSNRGGKQQLPPISSVFERKSLVLQALLDLGMVPGFLLELFINFDCKLQGAKVTEEILKALCKAVFPAPGNSFHEEDDEKMPGKSAFLEKGGPRRSQLLTDNHRLALQCLVQWLHHMHVFLHGEYKTLTTDLASADESSSYSRKLMLQQCVEDFNKKPAVGVLRLSSLLSIAPCIGELMERSRETLLAGKQSKHRFSASDNEKAQVYEIGVFLRTASGLDKTVIGEFISQPGGFGELVREAFCRTFSFRGQTLDGALRVFLDAFRLPVEAQQIDRVIQAFAHRWFEGNMQVLADRDAVHTLSFSLIMLNTDAHNDQVKDKMTLPQFISNNRGINGGANVPEALLMRLYSSIKLNEIKMSHAGRGLNAGSGEASRDAMPSLAILLDTMNCRALTWDYNPYMRWVDISEGARRSCLQDVRALFNTWWPPVLAGLSQVLELCFELRGQRGDEQESNKEHTLAEAEAWEEGEGMHSSGTRQDIAKSDFSAPLVQREQELIRKNEAEVGHGAVEKGVREGTQDAIGREGYAARIVRATSETSIPPLAVGEGEGGEGGEGEHADDSFEVLVVRGFRLLTSLAAHPLLSALPPSAHSALSSPRPSLDAIMQHLWHLAGADKDWMTGVRVDAEMPLLASAASSSSTSFFSWPAFEAEEEQRTQAVLRFAARPQHHAAAALLFEGLHRHSHRVTDGWRCAFSMLMQLLHMHALKPSFFPLLVLSNLAPSFVPSRRDLLHHQAPASDSAEDGGGSKKSGGGSAGSGSAASPRSSARGSSVASWSWFSWVLLGGSNPDENASKESDKAARGGVVRFPAKALHVLRAENDIAAMAAGWCRALPQLLRNLAEGKKAGGEQALISLVEVLTELAYTSRSRGPGASSINIEAITAFSPSLSSSSPAVPVPMTGICTSSSWEKVHTPFRGAGAVSISGKWCPAATILSPVSLTQSASPCLLDAENSCNSEALVQEAAGGATAAAAAAADMASNREVAAQHFEQQAHHQDFRCLPCQVQQCVSCFNILEDVVRHTSSSLLPRVWPLVFALIGNVLNASTPNPSPFSLVAMQTQEKKAASLPPVTEHGQQPQQLSYLPLQKEKEGVESSKGKRGVLHPRAVEAAVVCLLQMLRTILMIAVQGNAANISSREVEQRVVESLALLLRIDWRVPLVAVQASQGLLLLAKDFAPLLLGPMSVKILLVLIGRAVACGDATNSTSYAAFNAAFELLRLILTHQDSAVAHLLEVGSHSSSAGSIGQLQKQQGAGTFQLAIAVISHFSRSPSTLQRNSGAIFSEDANSSYATVNGINNAPSLLGVECVRLLQRLAGHLQVALSQNKSLSTFLPPLSQHRAEPTPPSPLSLEGGAWQLLWRPLMLALRAACSCIPASHINSLTSQHPLRAPSFSLLPSRESPAAVSPDSEAVAESSATVAGDNKERETQIPADAPPPSVVLLNARFAAELLATRHAALEVLAHTLLAAEMSAAVAVAARWQQVGTGTLEAIPGLEASVSSSPRKQVSSGTSSWSPPPPSASASLSRSDSAPLSIFSFFYSPSSSPASVSASASPGQKSSKNVSVGNSRITSSKSSGSDCKKDREHRQRLTGLAAVHYSAFWQSVMDDVVFPLLEDLAAPVLLLQETTMSTPTAPSSASSWQYSRTSAAWPWEADSAAPASHAPGGGWPWSEKDNLNSLSVTERDDYLAASFAHSCDLVRAFALRLVGKVFLRHLPSLQSRKHCFHHTWLNALKVMEKYQAISKQTLQAAASELRQQVLGKAVKKPSTVLDDVVSTTLKHMLNVMIAQGVFTQFAGRELWDLTWAVINNTLNFPNESVVRSMFEQDGEIRKSL